MQTKQIKVKLVENKPNSLLKKIFIYVVCKNKPNKQKKKLQNNNNNKC